MAARAGAVIADAEFVQFHPTAIAIGRDPAPLATEALRGEGATLIDETGRRFMPAIHADAELAPRDVVARAIHREIARGPKRLPRLPRSAWARNSPTRFPDRLCRLHGGAASIPPRSRSRSRPPRITTWAASRRDARGRTSLEGLWASANAPRTGLHGANRLASNSLLEALVFGARVADDVRSQRHASRRTRHAARARTLRRARRRMRCAKR